MEKDIAAAAIKFVWLVTSHKSCQDLVTATKGFKWGCPVQVGESGLWGIEIELQQQP